MDLVAEPDDATPVFGFISLTDFEEAVLRGELHNKNADAFVSGVCPKCKRPYKETHCEQCEFPKGCSFCHLQKHIVKETPV